MKLRYKNIGTVTKEFYGVKFKPGDTKEVPGYINAKTFIRIESLNNVPGSSTTVTPVPDSSVKSTSDAKVDARVEKGQETKKSDSSKPTEGK